MDYISVSGTGSAARTRGSAALPGRIAGRLGAAVLVLGSLPGATPTGGVDVSFQQLRSERGMLRICLTRDPDNYPNCTDDRAAITRNVHANRPDLVLAAIPAGNWALAVIHDENGNGRLDTFAGIPREGVGFSRNPHISFGPPRFRSAEFAVAGSPTAQDVRLRYFL